MYRNYVILPRPDNRRRVFPLGKIGFASGRRGREREWTRRLRLTGENRNGAIDRVSGNIGSTRGHSSSRRAETPRSLDSSSSDPEFKDTTRIHCDARFHLPSR